MQEYPFKACAGCGTKDNWKFWRADIKGQCQVWCHACHHGKQTGIPDVWYGYGSGVHTEENIADPKTGEPIPFYDKESKKAAMKIAGVREAGDKVHGARNEGMHPTQRKTYFT